jgi:hypothetical protein
MSPASFAVIGAGWRGLYFLRIARALPDRFRVTGIVVRDPDRARRTQAEWGVPAHPSLQALLGTGLPDFLALAVTRASAPALLAEAAAANLPVMPETPPAADLAGLLQVWRLVEAGARIQAAEQYLFHPWHAARLALVRSGRLGDVSQVQISIAHAYHGMSLLRLMLGVGFDTAHISARTFSAPLVAGPGRQGPPTQQEVISSEQVIAQVEFGAKLGIVTSVARSTTPWSAISRISAHM